MSDQSRRFGAQSEIGFKPPTLSITGSDSEEEFNRSQVTETPKRTPKLFMRAGTQTPKQVFDAQLKERMH